MSSGGEYVNTFDPPTCAIAETPYQQYNGMAATPITDAQVQGMMHMANLAGNQPPKAVEQLTAASDFENPYSTIRTSEGVKP